MTDNEDWTTMKILGKWVRQKGNGCMKVWMLKEEDVQNEKEVEAVKNKHSLVESSGVQWG